MIFFWAETQNLFDAVIKMIYVFFSFVFGQSKKKISNQKKFSRGKSNGFFSNEC